MSIARPGENTAGLAELARARERQRREQTVTRKIVTGTTSVLDSLRQANQHPDHVADRLRAIIQGDL